VTLRCLFMDLRLSIWHFRLIEGSPMKIILEKLTVGLLDTTQLVRLTMRLLIAMLLGQWHEVKDTIPCFDFAASRLRSA